MPLFLLSVEEKLSLPDPQGHVLSTKKDLFASEGLRACLRDKDRRQRLREKGKQTTKRGQRCLSHGRQRLPLDREETDIAYRKIVVYKGISINLLLV